MKPIFLLLLLLLIYEETKSDTQDGLLAVIVFYKHGESAPMEFYPTDPYNNLSYWPMEFGQLTDVGKTQLYELGQWLSSRYGNFMSIRDVYVQSINYDRSLISAQNCLAGLFSVGPNQTWNPEPNLPPIPIHTTALAMDAVLAMEEPCLRYEALYDSLLNTPPFLRIQDENRELYAYIANKSKFSVSNLQELQKIYDVLYVEDLHNLTLPNWTAQVYPTKMQKWTNFTLTLATYTPQLAELKTGLLFNEIYNNIERATQNVGPKMYMYSGDASTIANILNTLNIFDLHQPPYGATILFELRSRNSEAFINIFYKNATIPTSLILKTCEFDCSLEKFKQILDEIRLNYDEWKWECSVPLVSLFSAVFRVFFCLLLVMLLVYVIYILCSLKSAHKHYVRIPSLKSNIL